MTRAAFVLLPLVALAAPGGAQSLHQTHRLAWHPAGKLPAVVHQPRGREGCEGRPVQQAGKGALLVAGACRGAVACGGGRVLAR